MIEAECFLALLSNNLMHLLLQESRCGESYIESNGPRLLVLHAGAIRTMHFKVKLEMFGVD